MMFAKYSPLLASTLFLALATPGCAVDSPSGTTSQALGTAAPSYLAIGDSIPFGYNPYFEITLLGGLASQWGAPSQFHGYPQDVGAALGLPVIDTGCPGETSGSFFDVTQPDNGCQQRKAAYEAYAPEYGDGLHTDYGTSAQIDYVDQYLSGNENPRLITVGLGANDLLVVQNQCAGDQSCLLTKIPATAQSAGKNVGDLLATIRGQGYTGPIVVQNYYQTNYLDPTETLAINNLNAALAAQAAMYHATVAQVDRAFREATLAYDGDACAAGLLISLGDGTCNIHPNDAGRALITQAVLAAAQ